MVEDTDVCVCTCSVMPCHQHTHLRHAMPCHVHFMAPLQAILMATNGKRTRPCHASCHAKPCHASHAKHCVMSRQCDTMPFHDHHAKTCNGPCRIF